MPIYDYRCQNEDCQFVADELAKWDDYEMKECPLCHQKTWKRLPAAPMVMTEAIPDGMTSRFEDLKTAHVLKKAAAKAAGKGDVREESRIKKERKKVFERSNK